MLAAERAHPARDARDLSGNTEEAVDQLRSATQQARPVRVRYVTADGQPTERELAPLDLAAGAIRAVDRDTAQVITIPLARISSVLPASLDPIRLTSGVRPETIRRLIVFGVCALGVGALPGAEHGRSPEPVRISGTSR